MRQNRTCVVSAVIICLLWGSLIAQEKSQELSLREAVAIALEHNAQVLQARESITGAEAKLSESRSAEYPVLNAQASYARMGPIGEFTVSIGPIMPPITMKFGIENSYSAGLSLQHSLFNWGRTQAGVDMNMAGMKLSESSFELVRHNTAYQVIQLFYGILVSREAINVLDQSLNSLAQRLKMVKSRYDAGLASNFDVLTIEVQIATVKTRKIDMESNLKKIGFVFNRLLGRDIQAPVNLKGTLAYDPAPLDIEQMKRAADSRRRELEQLKCQEEMSIAQRNLSNSLDKPNLNLSVTWGLRNGFMPNLDALRGNWNAGLVLAYPVFDGFKTRNQVEQADVNVRLAQMRYDDVKNSIILELNQSLADLQANEEKIQIEEVKVKQAAEALKIADERYEKGFLSAVDFLDSQTSLESAKMNLLQAVYNAIIGKINLEKAAGIQPY